MDCDIVAGPLVSQSPSVLVDWFPTINQEDKFLQRGVGVFLRWNTGTHSDMACPLPMGGPAYITISEREWTLGRALGLLTYRH